MACRSAVVKHAHLWPIYLWPPQKASVLQRQFCGKKKTGETAAPPNDPNATNAVTVDPMLLATSKILLEV